jgi:hypothetical protein
MVGSEVPGVETLTPGLIIFPPMNVAPMMTCSGPTFGGMKVKTGDAVDDAEAGGVVAALALATGAARTSGARAAVIAASFRVRITSLRGRDTYGEPMTLPLLIGGSLATTTEVPPLKTDPMTVGPMATCGPWNISDGAKPAAGKSKAGSAGRPAAGHE